MDENAGGSGDESGGDDDEPSPAVSVDLAPVVPNHWIVLLRPQASARLMLAASPMAGIRPTHVYEHAVQGFAAQLSDSERAQLAHHSDVVLLEPDLRVKATAEVQPGVARIGTLLNTTANIDGVDQRVDVDIAIIDSGIDLDHPDLLVVNHQNFINGALTGDDNNGHGTHVAGIAAAFDNGSGVVGVAPGARLWALKCLDQFGNGQLSDIIQAVDFVTANATEIEVANMSLGAWGNSFAWRQAVQNSVQAGVVHVVAAGNDGLDIYGNPPVLGGTDFIPAAFPEAMAVSAMIDTDGVLGGLGAGTQHGLDDTFASFTNFSHAVDPSNPVVSQGAAIDVAAPGSVIFSTIPGGGYGFLSGTSMASPHVAGAVGLWVAAYGRAQDSAGVVAIRQAVIDSGEAQTDWRPGGTFDPDPNPERLVRPDRFETVAPVCGDALCTGGETCGSCPADCGPCPVCGDGIKNGLELCDGSDLGGLTCVTLGKGYSGGTLACANTCDGFDESGCTSCGDGTCDPSETCGSCAADCGGCPGPTTLFYDPFPGLGQWTEAGEGDWDVQPLHETTGYGPGGSGAPVAHLANCLTGCTLTSPAIDSRGYVSASLSLRRFVDVNLDAPDWLRVELWNGNAWTTVRQWMGGSGDDNKWHDETLDLGAYLGVADVRIRLSARTNRTDEIVQVDDVRLTGVAGTPPSCGNGSCGPGETCSSCSSDCGPCDPVCGDGSCAPEETCVSCPGDCGPCDPQCGNGTCETGETCMSCTSDCGTCGQNVVLLDERFPNLSAWTETGEGDWNVEPLHSSNGYPPGGSGTPAAHADTCSTGCTISLTNAINLQGYSTATLSLLRFVDVELDTGEYLGVELWNGSTWAPVLEWGGQNGDDNLWHAEQVNLAPYLGVTAFRIRFVTKSNKSSEHVHVDDVKVVATVG